MIKNQSYVANFLAWDTSANAPKTGDSGNFTMRLIQDGATPATPSNSVSEPDSTNCPGVYELVLTAGEMNYNSITLCGKSSTADVVIYPLIMHTERGQVASIYGKLPSKSYLAGSANSDGDVQLNEATGALPAGAFTNHPAVQAASLATTAKQDVAKSLADQAIKSTLQGGIVNGSILDYMFPLIDTCDEASNVTSQRYTASAQNTSFRRGTLFSVIFTDLDNSDTYPSNHRGSLLGSFISTVQSGESTKCGAWQIIGGYFYNQSASRIMPGTKFGVCERMSDADLFDDNGNPSTTRWDATDDDGDPDRSGSGWTLVVKDLLSGTVAFPGSSDDLEIRGITGQGVLAYQQIISDIYTVVNGRNAQSKIFFVDKQATGNNSGEDWQNAFTTIAAATAKCLPGRFDRIYVRESSEASPDPSGYAENVVVPKGVQIIGCAGSDGVGTSTSKTSFRLIGDTGTLNAPVLEIGEGASVRNIRIEAYTGARTANIVKLHHLARLEDFDFGGVSNPSSVYMIEFVSGADHIVVENGHFGATNITNSIALIASNLSHFNNVTFDQSANQNYIEITGGRNRISDCGFAGVDSGKYAVNIQAGANYNEVTWNTWAGSGSFYADAGTENVIQNNGEIGSSLTTTAIRDAIMNATIQFKESDGSTTSAIEFYKMISAIMSVLHSRMDLYAP